MTSAEAKKSLESSLVHLTNCTLATAVHLAMLKKKTKSEYERQKNIAQFGVDRIIDFSLNCKGTRAEDVINKFGGIVQSYAEDIERRFHG